jgi:hypothetical protein
MGRSQGGISPLSVKFVFISDNQMIVEKVVENEA